MSSGTQPIDMRVLEETRRHINRLIEEVGRLSEASMSPVEYYGEVLKRILAAMAAPAGAVWTRTPQGNLQLQFHINLREVGLDRNEQGRAMHDELLRLAVLDPRPIHLLPHSGAGPAADGHIAPGNPTDFLLLLVPIVLNNEVIGLLEVWQGPDRPMNAINGFLQFMGTIAELAARYHRNQLMGQMAGQQQIWTQLEAFSRLIHGTLNPTEVAYHVANEGRRLIDCDRVSIGIRQGRKPRVEAVSGTDIVEKRSNLVQLMRRLMDAVLRWGEKLVYTGTKDEGLPPAVHKALDEYLAESNSKVLVAVPLKDEREAESKRPARSVMLMECFETQDEPQQLVARMEVVARHATSALYNAVEHRRIPMRFLWMPLAKLQDGIGGRARMITLIVLLCLGGFIGLMVFGRMELKMDSTGHLLPITRRWAFSEEKGVVERIEVRPNEVVLVGDNLLKLRSRELEGKLRALDAEVGSLRRSVAHLTGELNKAGGQAEGNIRKLLIEEQGKLDLKLVDQKTLRDSLPLIAGQPGFFTVKAPDFKPEENNRREAYRQALGLPPGPGTWTVLNSDFQENLSGKPVDPSMPLIRLGDKEGGWEIEMKIPQRHIRQVRAAYDRLGVKVLEVDLKVRSEPAKTFKGRLYLSRIGGEANPQRDDNNEVEPVVTAYVSIDDEAIPEGDRVPLELLVSGTEVLAKVRCGKTSMGYALFYGVHEFFCEKILFSF